MHGQRRPHIGTRDVADAAAGKHDDIQSDEFILVLSIAFAYHAFDTIPHHRTARHLARDCHAQARVVESVSDTQNGKTRVTGFYCAPKHALEVSRSGKPYGARETRAAGAGVQHSGRQLRTSLGTPRFEHQAPVLGLHASPKAVRTLTLQDTRLERSLHDRYPSCCVAGAKVCPRENPECYWVCPRTVNTRAVNFIHERVWISARIGARLLALNGTKTTTPKVVKGCILHSGIDV